MDERVYRRQRSNVLRARCRITCNWDTEAQRRELGIRTSKHHQSTCYRMRYSEALRQIGKPELSRYHCDVSLIPHSRPVVVAWFRE
ncbi:hypothetical protein GUITHDRAFT_150908 [Guillardia theta CCMP2712]|uniref:Uncharacterized protein n=1 Tax=Guillardia theta (strain CCMP2712) TaxID=905079 RepID=L1JTC2_GUITC|nr:hypothetical protein GUITHDRAFT_150908 [Guillardia theta CCMP2712]EKX51445.1 hypothetical protein GUITHDRAFT_150908 [Guillardia theta CCMP2712]|eukprot:XP_005838425.1 hypothetical protein GUITHDRAFT_150908 [Guillardia theta CCMP2712]